MNDFVNQEGTLWESNLDKENTPKKMHVTQFTFETLTLRRHPFQLN